MNNIVNVMNKEGQFVVSSRQVAEHFEKKHKHVLEKISDLVGEMNSAENSAQYFIEDSYKDASGKSNKEYLLTRDGFSLLVMGFTGSKALQWKLKYIEAFNKMEEELKKQNYIATPKTYKEALLQLVAAEEEKERLQLANTELTKEVEHKEDVIIGLVKDISLAEKRQRISQIIRHRAGNKYSERFGLLYSEFDKKYHIDTKRRLENAKLNGSVKKSTKRMEYICDSLGMTNELYEIAAKVFENDLKELMKEWENTINRG